MSDLVKLPFSATDPYTPEPADTHPVPIRLTRTDGRAAERLESARVLVPHVLLQTEGVLYIARGAEDRVRLYREIPVLVLDARRPLDVRETKYLAEARSLAAGSVANVGRRQALAFTAMEDAIVTACGAKSFQELLRKKGQT